MSESNKNQSIEMEDISSVSEKYRALKNPVTAYTTGLYKNLGNIIKTIAFILAFIMIILGFLLAFLLLTRAAFSIVTSFAVIIIFTILAAILFFPLFGLGHILCQNNEILKLLSK